MSILVIDNVDSFTYNLVELIHEATGESPTVLRNDVEPATVDFSRYRLVVLSPGPGTPDEPADLGASRAILDLASVPVLGVCLGHQALGHRHGARVSRHGEPYHGRVDSVIHDGDDMFAGIPREFDVVRYHSLYVDDLPTTLRATAWDENGMVMALRHAERPHWGVQFHPESISSTNGVQLLRNIIGLADEFRGKVLATRPPAGNVDPDEAITLHTRRLGEVDADTETAFLAVHAASESVFWLDSSSAGHDERARHSYFGDAAGPHAQVVTYDVDTRVVTVESAEGSSSFAVSSIFDYLGDQLETWEQLLGRRPDNNDGDNNDDDVFTGGYVGWLGYELKAETGGENRYSSPYPDAAFVFADRIVRVDHASGQFVLTALGTAGEAHDWFDHVARVLTVVADAPAVLPDPEDRDVPTPVAHASSDVGFHGRHSTDEYIELVERCKEHIAQGESYEICLTNSYSSDQPIGPLPSYRKLRRTSPVPYGSYMKVGETTVLGSSPECFLTVGSDRSVMTKPIKGTRPRGATPAEDARLRAELAVDPKDRAENLMIVDLLRNDLSRVCVPGTVTVPLAFDVETYSTVHQLVSTVRGELAPRQRTIDLVRAAFPGGSMTGAPKVRTMKLVDELENGPRGVYSGAIGWLGIGGTADLSIVIRTLVSGPERADFGVGGAVIALSGARSEYEETRVKAQTMRSSAVAAHAKEGDRT